MYIEELLEKFNVSLDLPEAILKLSFDEQYTKYEKKIKEGFTFHKFYSSSGKEIYICPKESYGVESYEDLDWEYDTVLWRGDSATGCGEGYNYEGISTLITN